MTNELISVIVPIFNVENYLGKCIQSICAQTYRNIEIILVDDGSTDRSGKICDEYAGKDPRIRVIHKPNGGLSDARNAGIEVAVGKWFSFIDSDDFISQDTIEKLYQAAISNHCQISVCNMVRIFEDGETQPFYNPVQTTTVLDKAKRFDTLNQPSVCNKLFDATLFEGVRFPKGKFYEDTFVYHILANRSSRIVLTGHDGYLYLSRRESILGQPRYTDRYFDMIEAVYERVTYLLAHNISHYGEEACLSLYAAVFAAEKHITKTAQNREKFQQMWEWYQVAYKHLIHRSDTGVKQKIRLFLLKNFPMLHNRIY